MKVYDVFASEGGYRVCGAVWAGCPVIDSSPWFATREEAENEVERMKSRAVERQALEIVQGYPPEFYSESARKRAEELENQLCGASAFAD